MRRMAKASRLSGCLLALGLSLTPVWSPQSHQRSGTGSLTIFINKQHLSVGHKIDVMVSSLRLAAGNRVELLEATRRDNKGARVIRSQQVSSGEDSILFKVPLNMNGNYWFSARATVLGNDTITSGLPVPVWVYRWFPMELLLSGKYGFQGRTSHLHFNFVGIHGRSYPYIAFFVPKLYKTAAATSCRQLSMELVAVGGGGERSGSPELAVTPVSSGEGQEVPLGYNRLLHWTITVPTSVLDLFYVDANSTSRLYLLSGRNRRVSSWVSCWSSTGFTLPE